MDSNGFPSPIFVVNYRLVTTEGPLHCALKAIKHASETCKDIYAFKWLSLTKFRASVLRLLPSEGPLHCARTSSIQTYQDCKDIRAFEWLSLIVFCRNFVLPFYVYYPLKVHSACARTTSIKLSNILETCKNICASTGFLSPYFVAHFDHPSALYIYYPLKLHSAVLVPLLFKHIRNL